MHHPARLFVLLLVCSFFNFTAQAQDTIHMMSYNLLHYYSSPDDSATRNGYFRTILKATHPDLLATMEIIDDNTSLNFLTQVLKTVDVHYDRAPYINGYDTNNSFYFNSTKFSCTKMEVVKTTLRDINHYYLITKTGTDTLHIFVVHLKASSGAANDAQRKSESDSIRKVTNKFASNCNYLVCGDFNFYSETEGAYQNLRDTALGHGYFIDPITMTGSWNNSAYSIHHTQSPRVRSFGGGVNGGLDDRFDLILYSPAIKNGSNGIQYVSNSTNSYGNDGNHYNDSINQQPNTAVTPAIANALHYAADHLPVMAKFYFQHPVVLEGIAAINQTTIPIYPNPVQSEIAIDFSKFKQVQSIKIYNLLNQCVYSQATFTPNWLLKIDVSNLIAGAYFIQLQADQKMHTANFIKQ